MSAGIIGNARTTFCVIVVVEDDGVYFMDAYTYWTPYEELMNIEPVDEPHEDGCRGDTNTSTTNNTEQKPAGESSSRVSKDSTNKQFVCTHCDKVFNRKGRVI